MVNLLVLAAEGGGHAGNGFILPHDFNEVIWGSSAFLVVAALLIWKGGPAIRNLWNGRIERLSNELSEAATARMEAEAALADVEGRIANADQERARIRSEAHQTAAALAEQIAARAEADAAELRARVAADAEASKAQAAADLKAELAELVVGAAEAVVARNLDGQTQAELVERYITSLRSSGVSAR
ncbi:F0F1 ATP synthase subunit B family protein [Rhabdothermincola sediminis]|uniref:F0F1 ATP synthase subunit B family protein n=1 Tax=Rhabdothermincola sediminis TaxID=2751370 RepID=UPI001AA03469|nr:hypothetical protein [Rhabdothermincola sediminis]